jgi:capsular exopolysaccharide synthesis family protein
MRFLSGSSTLQVVPLFRDSLVIRPEDTVSGIANVFAVLRNNIRYSAQNVPEQSVLISSAVAGEGKSLVAVNLAVSFAQEGSRTCLVDADIQKGEHHAMEVAVKLAWEPQAGLATYLEGSAEMEHVVVPSVELPHLAFVGSGGRAANPPRALRSERAVDFFSRLQQEFDVVIVDSPPVLPVVDAAILAAHCRSVIHVVRYGYTRRSELEEAARRLHHVNAPLVGLVLNCARVGSSGYSYRRYAQTAQAM